MNGSRLIGFLPVQGGLVTRYLLRKESLYGLTAAEKEALQGQIWQTPLNQQAEQYRRLS